MPYKRKDSPHYYFRRKALVGYGNSGRLSSGVASKRVRLKDLRSIAAIYAERAGVPLTVASKVLGHADSSMTRRYQRHGAAMSDEQAADIERALGLTA